MTKNVSSVPFTFRSGWLVAAALMFGTSLVATAERQPPQASRPASATQKPATPATQKPTPATQKPAPGPQKPPANGSPLPVVVLSDEELERVGEETTDLVCNTACHGPEVLDLRRTVREWNDLIAEMVNRGAEATPRQQAIIKQYLKRYGGIVAVNTASAEDLSAVLGFSANDAQAIVAYRTKNGKFADADALAKVPGIDTSKIEEQPDAIRFN